MPTFESLAEGIGTYQSNDIGKFLQESLVERWPATAVEVVPVEREGNSMFDMIVKTDPITACEMRAFVRGFFTAHNNRHKLG
jgi:hypothetical protein